jgi:hypothetical protein
MTVPTAEDAAGWERVWQLVLAVAGATLTGIATAFWHLHARITGVSTKLDSTIADVRKEIFEGRREDEQARANGNKEVWQELRRQNEATTEWRGVIGEKVAALPTRDEIREMLVAVDRLGQRRQGHS